MIHGRAALSNPNIFLLIGALESVETEPKSEVVGAALVLGPFLGGILLENFGGRSPFAFAAVLGFIALLSLASFLRPGRGSNLGGIQIRMLRRSQDTLRQFNIAMECYGTYP